MTGILVKKIIEDAPKFIRRDTTIDTLMPTKPIWVETLEYRGVIKSVEMAEGPAKVTKSAVKAQMAKKEKKNEG